MVRNARTHITDDQTPAAPVPKHLTKQEFGNRLYSLMLGKGWNQSELAKRADMGRAAISTYIRGRSIPTPQSVERLAKALGVSSSYLLPNIVESAIDEDTPSFEMKVSTSALGTAWLRVNRAVSLTTAVKIAELLEADPLQGGANENE